MSNTDKNQDVTIAVIKNDIEYIKKEVGGIAETLAIMEKNYVKRTEVDHLFKEAQNGREELSARIKTVEVELAVFKAQVMTWGAAAVLALGIVQFIISAVL